LEHEEVADINADGNTDIVGLYGFNGTVIALSGGSGTQNWISIWVKQYGTVEM
jgi:hypothetical protein